MNEINFENEPQTDIQVSRNEEKIAVVFPGFSPEQVAVIKKTVAKGATDTELALFIYTATSAGLNPLLKEIWCYKDSKGNLLIFAGRDGFLKKAQQNPKFAGMRSTSVREKDICEINIPQGTVNHIITNDHNKNRGEITGAYAFVYRKDEEPTLVWVDYDTFNKGYNAWKTHPDDMICKVAEIRALKKAFGMAELNSEFDFSVTKDGRVSPIDHQLLPDFKRNQK
jgi:phage recombination protein Bet